MLLRRLVLLFMGLCLLSSQQAAIAHGITHIRVDDREHRSASRSVMESLQADHHDDFCLECLAFAQVTGAAPGCPVDLAVAPPPALNPCIAAACRVDGGKFLSFEARAPPIAR